MNFVFISFTITLSLFTFICLYKAYKGPTVADRIVATNVILTKTVTILCVMSIIAQSPFYIDIAMVYALIGFISTVSLAKYLETGKLS
jgi:multicomponent Na+:H+ antiporter subunit F